ncbi:Membrane transporter [Rubellimicrobium thermophilum DSM 16684]|uniref:Guanidinium exporter n=2 Tax=Rubellimicrobium TaxID=295418 RepID=S9R1L5_9RHOB|nr:Membrane transporter [Rubellimicrobium thermophilum DSM 16684]
MRPQGQPAPLSPPSSRDARRERPPNRSCVCSMPWLCLLLAGLLEVVWAVAMKQSQGFTRPGPTVLMVVAMLGSFGLLALAMRSLPLGTAYAVWTGIGAVGAFALGILVLGEAATPGRLAAAALIVSGIALMKLSGS